MNELENEMLPFAHVIRTLTKELGYDPSEGCTTFQEVLDKLPENEKIKIEYETPLKKEMPSVNLKVFDVKNLSKDDQPKKEIDFLLEPNASVVVNDKITEKRRTYMSPIPEIDEKTMRENLENIEKKRQEYKAKKDKSKNSIVSKLINKFIK